MPERELFEEFNQLLEIAADLRGLPGHEFKVRLKAELLEAARKGKAMTAVQPVREGFHTVTPYLIVEGASELIDFLKQSFGAEERFRVTLPDRGIMHAEVSIGDSILEMADSNPQFKPAPAAIWLYRDDVDEAYQRALAAGATSIHEPVDQEYGRHEAGVEDRFGNRWYLSRNIGEAPRPEGFHAITPYLHPHGAAAVIDFLKQAFGAEEIERAQSPDGTIVHAQVRIGDSLVAMGEAHGRYQPLPSALHLYVENADAVYRRALAAGATSLSEPRDQSYGDRSGGVKDAFGNSWFIATHIKDVPFPT